MKLLLCTQVLDTNHPILGFFHGWVLEFAQHFDEVHVVCLQKGEYVLPSNVFVYSLGKELGEHRIKYLWRFYRYFGHIFFRVRVQYVFFHMGYIYNNLAAPFFLVRKLFGTAFYWWKTHGTLTPLGRSALFFSDAVYTAAPESFPLVSPKKRVVGHAIEAVSPSILSTTKSEPPVLLFVGRVTPVKKIELVIATGDELHKRGYTFHIRIVGATPDAAYADLLAQRIAQTTYPERFALVGPKKYEELGAEFAAATVCMNPSETGGIDKVVLESMQCGVPAVALRRTYGSILDRFGLSVERQDVLDYVRIIERLSTDKEELLTLKDALRREVTEHHSLSTLSQRIFNI